MQVLIKDNCIGIIKFEMRKVVEEVVGGIVTSVNINQLHDVVIILDKSIRGELVRTSQNVLSWFSKVEIKCK